MSKQLDYSKRSHKDCLEVAEAVHYLGGSCSLQTCADRLKLKVTGSFGMLISATVKHGLIENKRGQLTTTGLFKNIKHSYDPDEKLKFLRDSFLNIPLYSTVYNKFKGRDLPTSMLDKIFIKDFGVEEDAASRIASYFIDGAKATELLQGNALIDLVSSSNNNEEIENPNDMVVSNQFPANQNIPAGNTPAADANLNNNGFVIHIYGSGINNKFNIEEEEDFAILNAVIAKIKKRMKQNENE